MQRMQIYGAYVLGVYDMTGMIVVASKAIVPLKAERSAWYGEPTGNVSSGNVLTATFLFSSETLPLRIEIW